MISLFKKKSEIQKLDIKYQQLLAEAFRLSTINRSQSDAKVGEAEEVFKQIQLIRSKNN